MSSEQTPADSQDNLIALLLGDLSGEEQTRVEERLMDSSGYRAELEAFRNTLRAVRSLPRVDPSPGFSEKLHEKIERMRTIRQRLRRTCKDAAGGGRAANRISWLRWLGRELFVRNRMPVAASIAAAALFLLVSPYIVVMPDMAFLAMIGTPEQQRRNHSARLRMERWEAVYRGTVTRATYHAGRAHVGRLVPEGEGYIIDYHGVDEHERCLSLLTPEQHLSFEAGVQAERDRVRNVRGALVRAAQWRRLSYDAEFVKAPVASGLAQVPAQLARKRLGDTQDVALVSITDRIEIWKLEDWLNYAEIDLPEELAGEYTTTPPLEIEIETARDIEEDPED